MSRKEPVIEVLERVDTPRRSMRVQRELVVDDDGARVRTMLALYRPTGGGKYVRESSFGLKRCEMRAVIRALEKALKDEPVVDPKQGVLL